MNRLLLGSLTFVFATALLGAQNSGTGNGTTDRINRRAQQMREQYGKGKQVKSHVRVQVRLKNGNRLRGVVKDGRLVERVTGLRFVDAHAADKGAGIRLWYSGGTRNYVFVPFQELQTYNVLQRLTAKQLAEIEAEMQMREAKRAEQLRQAMLARDSKKGPLPAGPGGETAPGEAGGKPDGKPGGKPDGKPAKAGDEVKAEPTLQDKHRKWFTLLQDYPPDAGWNAVRRDEIERRFSVIGVRPSDREQRFVDEFAEWKKACAHFGTSTKDDGKEGGKGTGTKEEESNGKNSRKSRRRSRKK